MSVVGKLWLIGGTGDSVRLVQSIAKHSLPCLVTVTTSTAINLYPTHSNITIEIGKLDKEGIKQLCKRETVRGIIDASHPFAINISQQVMEFANTEGIPYLRYERPSLKQNAQAIYLDNFEDLVKGNYLKDKRVLLTVGCQALSKFKSWHKNTVLYARILPKLASLKMALNAGFAENQIIALRPPITLELERALWQQWKINLVVTKASGKQGGEDIKATVAQELDIPLIVIQRPSLTYPQQTEQMSDIIEFCYQCFQG
ncbi:probable precorrin-6x reductase [Crocosphaera subtropica ATCC 51142]|uniref:Probable precorrin-6x reductase n=1 Tax=Crocosphaera subtropica (strain ATCC 51142 / BH68) TaxID=43989 RepID=B1WXZ8_CROS5|nr:cobalt-precorrin-6A reductase [Crocosphaera subtropica]ACB50985.1 probable precorrin-6x reductase [Crocosphaera subtropica ATCC 51142]